MGAASRYRVFPSLDPDSIKLCLEFLTLINLTRMGDDDYPLMRYELLVLGDREADRRAVNASNFAVMSTFRGLRLGAKLTARIRAVNSAGVSPWSEDAFPVRNPLDLADTIAMSSS
jgi:hypothetical protein